MVENCCSIMQRYINASFNSIGSHPLCLHVYLFSRKRIQALKKSLELQKLGRNNNRHDVNSSLTLRCYTGCRFFSDTFVLPPLRISCWTSAHSKHPPPTISFSPSLTTTPKINLNHRENTCSLQLFNLSSRKRNLGDQWRDGEEENVIEKEE